MAAPPVAPGVGAEGAVALAAALRSAGVRIGTGQVEAYRRAVQALGHDRGDRGPAQAVRGPDRGERGTEQAVRGSGPGERGTEQAVRGPDRGAGQTVEGADQADRYWAGRLTLITDPTDLATYDRVFRLLANAAMDPEVAAGDRGANPSEGGVDAATDRWPIGGAGPHDELVAGGAASERERLRHRRFDHATEDERAAIALLLDRLRVAVPHRRSRRTRAGHRGQLDLGRTLERALATDGELVERSWRRPRQRPRRLVVLLDVSGSMAAHARALLRFAVAARRTADREAARRVEVFAFGTRLTRLSDALAARDPDAAIAAAAERVVDWDGGTRIGASIDDLLRTWGRRGVLRGAVVIVCSDGLERGDPALLSSALARLRRHVHRIVWVNPLAGDPRYEPSQRGMAAALPHIDDLVPGHDLASLEELSELLERSR